MIDQCGGVGVRLRGAGGMSTGRWRSLAWSARVALIATGALAGVPLPEAAADTLEGAIIQSKALKDERLMGKQTRLYRNYIKLIFGG